MKKIIFLITALVIAAASGYAQDDNGRKPTKQERKAQEARIDSMKSTMAEKAIEDSAFVLEADQVTFKRGYTAHVTSNTNFVAVCGGRASVQVDRPMKFWARFPMAVMPVSDVVRDTVALLAAAPVLSACAVTGAL